MNRQPSLLAAALLALLPAAPALAQSYSNAVMALNPTAYWPLQENVQPPFGAYIATNLGAAGVAGNGFYQTWFQPWNTGTNTLYYQTNNIQHTTGAIADGDTALQCTRSAAGAGGYVVFPRATNGVANPAVSIQPPFSIELWAKPAGTVSAVMPLVNQGRIPTQGDASYGYATTNWTGFSIGQYGTIFFFATFNGNGNAKQEIDVGLTANAWQHIVITFNGTNEIWYKNGVQAATRTIPNSAANALGQLYVPDPTSPLLIGTGSLLGAGNGGTEFSGSIDDVAIYPQVLTATAIANHYAAASATDGTYQTTVLADNPTIYVRLDEPAFPSGNYPPPTSYPVANNYGALGSAANGFYQPGTVPGVAGPNFDGFGANSRAVAINGFSGAVDIGAGSLPTDLNPTGTSPVTVAAWFQANPADAPARYQEIVSHGNSSWRLAMDSTDAGPRFNPGNGPELSFPNDASLETNGYVINDGRWHFIAGVSDGTNDYLYLDGVLAKSGASVGSVTGSGIDALLGGSPSFLVPVYNGTSTSEPRYFDGQISQVAFFTNALTDAQIAGLYARAGVAPYFWLAPSSLTTNAGVNVTISAGAHGSAPLSYQWFQNGAAVPDQTNADLTFTPAAVNNAGSYVLVVSNSFGSITSDVVSLVLYGAPTVQAQSATDIRVFAGTSPTLAVSANGAQPISYQWSSDGVPIPAATNSTYTIANAQTSATYTCAITNFVGAASPGFQPVAVTVLPDPAAPYPTAVLSSGPAAYFRLDETPDDGSGNTGRTAYDNAGGYNAVYHNVLLGQPGYNSLSDSSSSSVEFGDFPPDNNYAGDVPGFLNFGTPNGGNAQFSVEAWFNQYFISGGGEAIVALGYGNGGEEFDLDTGATGNGLRFFVRNAAGTVSSATTSYAPANDGLWHHVVGVCNEAAGHVYLYLDGMLVGTGNITPGTGLLSSSMPLTIGARESGNNDPVSYDFQFIGTIDEVALYNRSLSAAEVQNHYISSGIAPVITALAPSNLTTNEGATAVFTATVTGTAPLTFQWYDPANNPIGGNSSTLTLPNVQQGQAGTYRLNVSNGYGSAETNATLTVQLGAPQLVADIQPPSQMVYAGDPVTFTIQVNGSLPLYYQWYLNGGPITDATNGSYTFPALAGTNSYHVAVSNSYSSGAGGPLISGTATVIGVQPPTVNPDDFTAKLKIQFTGYDRGETLRDFPVLVKLGTNVPGFSYSQFASPTGGDLRFADSSGTRALPYEIDEWNDSNGMSWAWVQIPRLSGTNDFIWAYWGNPQAADLPDYGTNGLVWVPAGFEGLPAYQVVYHLKESALPFADATLQHPATNGIAPVPSAGIVGTAGSFGGTGWLDAGTNDLGNAFTLSAWVNIPLGTSDIDAIWQNKAGGFSVPGIAFYVNSYQHSDQVIDLASGDGTTGNESTTAAGAVPFGSWHLVSAAVNRTNGTGQFYVDGVSAGSTTKVLQDFPTLGDLRLGQFLDGAFDFRGSIDEARIHSGLNSSNWVWASWATVAQNATFASYSSVVSTEVTLTFQVSGNNLILSWPAGTLQSASQVNGPYQNLDGATSPYTNSMTSAQQYYRVRVH